MKSKWVINNSEKVEILALGSSHMQTAINPIFFDDKLSNLAYGSQDYYLDSVLLSTYISKLKNLKTVLLELNYHSLEYANSKDFWRFCWYNYYHDTEIPISNYLKRISFLVNNPKFYLKQLQLLATGNKASLNKYGFSDHTVSKIFSKLNYDAELIESNASNRLRTRHVYQSKQLYEDNFNRLISMIKACKDNNVNVVIVSTPMYETYLNHLISTKQERRKKALFELKNEFPDILILDYLDSDLAKSPELFSNDDHLNPLGAKRFSKLILGHINDRYVNM